MSNQRTVYVFLIRRPIDNEAWPAVYTDLRLAESAYGRVSAVVPVELSESEDEQ